MKKIASYITFLYLTFFAITTSLPVIAGACSNHRNKTAEIKCAKDDTECRSEKTEKFDIKKSIKS